MNERSRALATTIAYAAGIGYMIHLAREEPQTMVNVLAVVGAVAVAFMLASGAIAVFQMIAEWWENIDV